MKKSTGLIRANAFRLVYSMASILLSSSKISQMTNVHNYKLQAFLPWPVYFNFFNF